MEIKWNNEILWLSPLRAIFWPRKKVLFIADMHLGKTGYFRNNGIQIPSTVLEDDLKRLSLLIQTHQPETVIVAGDMFHHSMNADTNIFKQWRKSLNGIDLLLVPGNHDKLLDIDYQSLGIVVVNKTFELAPFIISHQPAEKQQGLLICGHVHPGFTMAGKAKQSLRLPCFVVSPTQIILPAFSAFTGLFTRHNFADSNCYLIANDLVLKV